MTDIIIVGGGPAGLAAAVYARRANKTVTLIEKNSFGGQMVFSPKIENYPGFESVSGEELADAFVSQALNQGTEVEIAEVTGLVLNDDGTWTVVTDSGDFVSRAVIIATGAEHRHLGVENEEKFIGNGVSFCAVCDGAFYEGKNVIMIGGGNSALQEAILLSELCNKVTVVQNLAFLTGEEKLQKILKEKSNVEIILSTVVEKVIDGDEFTGIVVKNTESGESKEINSDGMFVAIGLKPENGAFASVIDLDSAGYAASDEFCTTKAPGVFVAGDCRTKKVRQITTAIADGATAALAACSYLNI